MIYLFEDRPTRIGQYLGRPTLPDGIALAKFEFDGMSNEVAKYISENFGDAELIFFHKSYVFLREENQAKYLDAINAYCTSAKISLVIFSGGIETVNYYSKNGTMFGSVNSKILYRNLDIFLIRKDIRVLCLGENFAKNEFMNYLRELHINFSSVSEDSSLSEIDRKSIIDLSKKYISSSDDLDKVFVEFYQWLNETNDLRTFSMVSRKLPDMFQHLITRR